MSLIHTLSLSDLPAITTGVNVDVVGIAHHHSVSVGMASFNLVANYILGWDAGVCSITQRQANMEKQGVYKYQVGLSNINAVG